MQIGPGSQLGPYKIIASLGAGGMGRVFRAQDTRLGRQVAIKVMADHLSANATALIRFNSEAKAVAALSHPNILAIHDVGSEQGVAYAVMELLNGETLRQRLQHGSLNWKKAIEIGTAVAEGLSAAHSKGIIHRDLKPENLFLTADGQVKILDFGLARIEADPTELYETRTFSPSPTQTGTILGTVGYMSPEQVKGEPVDARSDIFSLGCVLYEMVSGSQPFRRKTPAETHAAILYEEAPELATPQKDLPAEVERLFRHCLEKNREKRFQSARDLAFDLNAVLINSSGTKQQLTLPAKRARVRAFIGFLVLVPVLAVGIYFLWKHNHEPVRPGRPDPPESLDAIAVLPFVNASKDSDADYLSDGFSAGIRKSLADVRSLKVRPESAVAKFRGNDLDLQEVGQKLKVQAILTGTVRPRPGSITVTLELIDTRDNSLLWQESYQRTREQLQDAQEQVARQVCEKLQVQLTAEDRQRLAKRYTANSEAHNLFLKGRFAWNKRTQAGVKASIALFQQAVEKDPNYAMAFVGMANSYVSMGDYGWLPPQEAFPKAKEAAHKALALDEGLAEAHTTLAAVSFQFDWDIKGAENSFRRALELNPNIALTHFWYGRFLIQTGRFSEGIAKIQHAAELDPTSLSIGTAIGVARYDARHYDEAVRHLQKILDLEPNYVPALIYLGETYFQQGLHQEALDRLNKAVAFGERDPDNLEVLGCMLAKTGHKEEAQRIVVELEDRAKTIYVPNVDLALLLYSLGQKDQAFLRLENAYQRREADLVEMLVNPLYDEMRGDARMHDLFRRMGMADIKPANGK